MVTYGEVVEIIDPNSTFYGKRGIVVNVNRSAILVRLAFLRRGRSAITTRDASFTTRELRIIKGGPIDIIQEEA